MEYSFNTLGYYNGKYDEIEKMQIPMNDRVSWFGDAVYDVTYCRNYIVYNIREHMDRFFSSAEELGINIPLSYDEMCDLLSSLVKKLKSHEQMIYWQVSRGTTPRLHSYDTEEKGNIWVMLRPIPVKDTFSTLKLITVDDTRFYHCNIKTINLIPNVLASQKAKLAGADEAVFCRGDIVTECAHSNISIIKNGTFITHPTDKFILPGIARANLLKFCKMLGYPTQERAFTIAEMMDADEVIVSSSGSFCLQATQIDGVAVGGRAPEMLNCLRNTALADFIASTDRK